MIELQTDITRMKLQTRLPVRRTLAFAFGTQVLLFICVLLFLVPAHAATAGAVRLPLVTAHFTPLLPKLTVLPKDALPISILNLRAAVNSAESAKLERELTVLLLNRLTHERELFVLERRQLDTLSTEKDLQRDNSPFWN